MQQKNNSTIEKDFIDELSTDKIFNKKDWIIKMPKDVKKAENSGDIADLA